MRVATLNRKNASFTAPPYITNRVAAEVKQSGRNKTNQWMWMVTGYLALREKYDDDVILSVAIAFRTKAELEGTLKGKRTRYAMRVPEDIRELLNQHPVPLPNGEKMGMTEKYFWIGTIYFAFVERDGQNALIPQFIDYRERHGIEA